MEYEFSWTFLMQSNDMPRAARGVSRVKPPGAAGGQVDRE